MKMLEDYPEKVHKKLKKRARKGVPDSYRGAAWKALSCAKQTKEENAVINYHKIVKMKPGE